MEERERELRREHGSDTLPTPAEMRAHPLRGLIAATP